MLAHYVLVVAALAVLLGIVSRRLNVVPVTEPMIGIAAGVLLGPRVFGYLAPTESGDELFFELTRLLLAFTVMTVALRYPWPVICRSARSVGVLLVVVLPLMAATGAALAHVVLGVGWSVSFLLGAILAPTDPVLVSSLVSSEEAERALPSRERRALSLESAANDGLGLILVGVGIFATQQRSTSWLAFETIGSIAAAILLGLAVGLATGWAVRSTRGRELQTESTFLLFTLTFSVLVLALSVAAHIDGILAVFVAGLAYNSRIDDTDREAQSTVEEGVDRLLLLPVFVILGVLAPWSEWRAIGWPAVAFVALLLVVRRLPWLVAIGKLVEFPLSSRLWMGWFGPMGVAALFYVGVADRAGDVDPVIWTIATLAVVSSTVVHGATALPGRVWAQRWYEARRPDLLPET